MIPSAADNIIIKIGDGVFFLTFLKIICIHQSDANIITDSISGSASVFKSTNPKSDDNAITLAVARIIPTTQGRTPDKKAFTAEYFKRFFKTAEIKRIIMNDGKTTPVVAKSDPKIPPCVEPIKVAIFIASGPGVDSETAIKFINSLSDSQPFDKTVSCTSETIP